MSNVISLFERLPSNAPFADGSLADMYKLKRQLDLLHHELEHLLGNLHHSDRSLLAGAAEVQASRVD